jgi:hypothetical protein
MASFRRRFSSERLQRPHHAQHAVPSAQRRLEGARYRLEGAPREDAEEPALPQGEPAKGDGDREHCMAMLHGSQDLLPELLGEDTKVVLRSN